MQLTPAGVFTDGCEAQFDEAVVRVTSENLGRNLCVWLKMLLSAQPWGSAALPECPSGGREATASRCTGGAESGRQEEFLHGKGGRALGRGAGEVVESPSLQVFGRRVDVALRDMHGWWWDSEGQADGWTDGLGGLFQPR